MVSFIQEERAISTRRPFGAIPFATSIAAAVIVLLILPVLVGAEESSALRISEIVFDVDGSSREMALLCVTGLEVGREYASIEALDVALEEALQDLWNRRVFDDVSVERVFLDVEGDVQEVRVLFHVDDGWTMLPVPFYRYDSNSGHNPLAILYWDNIAGTLTNFQLSAGYSSRDWVTPFIWDVNLRWNKIRFLNREWKFAVQQIFTTIERADTFGNLELAYSRYKTKASVSSSVALSDSLDYSFSPEIFASYRYDTIENTIGENIPGDRIAVGYGHSLGSGDIDWHGTFRGGSSWSLSNGFSVDPGSGDGEADLSLSGKRFWYTDIPALFGDRTIPFNPAIYGKVTHSFDGNRYGRGSVLRGVADNRVYGETGVIIQSEATFRLVDIRRFGEFHISPFLDGAVFRKHDSSVDGDDLSAGAGFDLTFFPDFFRGFQGRASIGFDLRDPGSMEFFFIETLEF